MVYDGLVSCDSEIGVGVGLVSALQLGHCWWCRIGTILAAEQGRILLAQPSSAASIIILVLPTECRDTSLPNKSSVRL